MHLLLLVVLLALTVVVFVYGLRGTIYEVSLRRRNLGGVLIAIELFAFVVPGIFFFELVSLDSFVTFYMTESSVRVTSILILWSLFVLLVFIVMFSKMIFPQYLRVAPGHQYAILRSGGIPLVRDVALALLVAVTVVIQLMGMEHAFIQSLFLGEDLLAIRLANRYTSSVPTVVMSYFSFLSALATVALGLSSDRLTRPGRWLRMAVVLYVVSMSGQKAPIVYALVLLVVSVLSRSSALSVARAFWLGVTGIVVLFAILYAVAAVQFSGLDLVGFGQFLLNRIAVGQVHGVYEQFALKLHDPSYLWHAVPFANVVLDYSVFNKDLMMHMYGLRLATQDTGVMNSLFIGEAYAIGGYPLVFASPIIVALNYCVLSVTLIFALNATRTLPMVEAKRVVTLLVPGIAFFTGDIAGLLLFKLNVMAFVFLFTVVGVASLLRSASKGSTGSGRMVAPIG